jgi:two-component system sensor histidine kinase MtrB
VTTRRSLRLALGLRARSTIGFAIVTALVVGVLAVVSYQRIAVDLLSEREEVARRQAYANARIARARLQGPNPDPGAVVASLESRQGTPLLRFGGEWFAATVGAGSQDVPASLLSSVVDGHAAHQRVRLDGELSAVIGTPVVAIDAEYFEFVPLEDVETTLGAVRQSLALGAVVAAAMGGLLGAFASRTALRPLRTVARAAATVRGGALDTEVETTGDTDLDPLVRAFNDMVAEVRHRIDRDARFAANVTHELRGPLAALAAACEIARRHADDPDEVRRSLDDLATTVGHFNRLVVDLLDISRMEAGVAELNVEPTLVSALVEAVVGDRQIAICIADGTPEVASMDKRRMGQSLANLIENADRYGGGATTVTVSSERGRLIFAVDDSGPGVPEHERTYIFERFARGKRAESIQGGTGLGLALVTEHLRLHGGTVTVGDAPGGGARFCLELPLEEAG